MATLSVNILGRDSQVEEQSRRFWTILKQTREEAELQSMNIGVYIATEEYEFLRLDSLTNTWIPITDDKLYATRQLPEGLRYRLWLDSREIVMKPKLPDRGSEEEDDEELSDEEKKEATMPQALRTIERDAPPRTKKIRRRSSCCRTGTSCHSSCRSSENESRRCGVSWRFRTTICV